MKKRIVLLALCALTVAVLPSCKGSNRAAKSKGKTAQRSGKLSDKAIREKYAAMMGVSSRDIKNVALYRFVDDWTGVPYRYGGTTQSGVDCSGFVGQLYSEVYHKRVPRTTSEIEREAKNVGKSKLREGDIVVFDINGKKNAHVGVYLMNGHFVHASSSNGVVVSKLDNPYYEKAFNRGGRL